jgi:LysR family transcriptional regulator, nitrogen assimilation regulatory protein
MDLRQLRYFVAIVEQGSFSRAAEVLRVAQPALSQHMRHMEAELGLPLLHRGPRGAVPTEAGTRLLGHARAILDRFAEIPDSVRGADRPVTGDVRIGLPGTVSEILSVPLIERVRAEHPGIRLRVAEAMSGYILDWLNRDAVDLAVLYNPAAPKGLVLRHALTEDLCLFGRPPNDADLPEGPVSLSRAAALPLILPALSHGLRDLIEEAAQAAGVAVSPGIEIDSYARIKELAARGHGFGILPRAAVAAEVAACTVRAWPIGSPPLRRRIYLAHAADRPLSAAASAVSGVAWDLLGELVRSGVWPAELAG